MPNTYVNKVQLADGTSLLDISDTTATASDVLNSKYFYTAAGEKKQGSIASKTSSDLQASGATVTVPAGNYASQASKSVASGTVTAPASISGTSATVSTGTNTLTLSKTVSVTPSVTTAGYVSSGTAGNSSVSLTASVNTRSSSDLSASGATVTAPAGYYASQATKSVASGTVTAPASISGTSATVSTGTNTLTLTKTVSVTPSVTTAGYVSSGTAGNSSVSLTASVNTRSSSDLTASNLTVTAPAGYYASNATKTLSDQNLIAENIKKDVVIFGTTGTYEGGGGGTTWQTEFSGTVTIEDWGDNVKFVYIEDYFQTHSYFAQGDTYRITWQSTPYTCVATQSETSTYGSGYILGNPSMLGYTGSGNNEPFGCQCFYSDDLLFACDYSLYGSFTLVIEKQVGGGGSTLITKTITQNGTYDAEDDDADGYSSVTVNVSGGGGLVYETGTYTPTSDVTSATVSFANTHSTLPAIVVMAEASNSLSSWTNYSLFEWNYINTGDLFGGCYPRSSAYLGYGRVDTMRKSNTSSLSATNTNTLQYPSSETSDDSATYPRYWVTASSFKAYASNTSYYWRSGRTYKWIAIWVPTT